MQRTVLFLIFLICGARLYSQQTNYLYIEAEKGQLFYVKIGDKVYSSSPGGYAIITGLKENNYSLSVGFPKNVYPEQYFTVALNQTDKGFQLKNLGEKGWALFDLQTMDLINSNNNKDAEQQGQAKKTDAFSTLLSQVVNDPAVLEINKKPTPPPAVTPPSQPKQVASQPQEVNIAIKDTSMPIASAAPIIPTTPAPSTPPSSSSASTLVEKISELQSKELYEAVYLDNNDTIRISYPIDKSIMTAPPATPLSDTNVEVEYKKPSDEAIRITNSDCLNFANDQDVDKLRVKILGQGDIDNKLSAAKKYFRTKCFSVKQIKALAELFEQDDHKYQFFDIAYPFTSDADRFYELENELQSDYFKNRFKAMIKK